VQCGCPALPRVQAFIWASLLLPADLSMLALDVLARDSIHPSLIAGGASSVVRLRGE
jgi:hypothetical protein